MIIRKMTASYGKLQNSTLELKPGLNIIAAPNESGKSTWCSFIKNMLYGIDSSAREKGGVKPDKTLFAPWSGAAMSGSMDIEYDSQKISLSRKGTASAPMRELSAVYTGTSQPVAGIGSSAGEALLGVPREVFERSAFIGQGSVSVTASPELEKRIAAIVQTGDENVSRTDALERLRAEARRRRHNKSGALPELERQIEVLKGKISDIEGEETGVSRLKEALSRAIERRDELKANLEAAQETHRETAINELDLTRERIRELEVTLDEQKTAAMDAESALKGSRFQGATPEGIRARAAQDTERVTELKVESEGREFWQHRALIGTVIAAVLAIAAAFFYIYGTVLLGAVAIGGFIVLIYRNKKLKELQTKINDIYAAYGATDTKGVLDAVSEHEALYTKHAEACAQRDETQQKLETERSAQKAREDAILRGESRTDSPASDIALRFEEAEADVLRLRGDLAAHEGRLGAMGSREALSEKIAEMTAEHEKLTLEYEALVLAAATLDEAGTEIQNRMTPRLSARASEIFARLTGGRYEAVALDRELRALARLTEDSVPHESAFLSAGALDQLYLAVRLAICELALPEDVSCPLILDDALGSFDDKRCAAALNLLHEMAGKRQILLFTCHSREAEILRQYTDVNITSA